MKHLSEITKKKISESNKKIIHTEDWNKKVALAQKGKHNSIKTEFKNGHKQLNTGKTHFKKGHTPWNKGKLMPIGEKANNWKGGISRAYKTGYYSLEYKKWREAVFKRDNYTCKCGNKEYITAHHIKSFAKYPKLRFRVSNGITLCETCHCLRDKYRARFKKGQSAAKPSETEGSETTGV